VEGAEQGLERDPPPVHLLDVAVGCSRWM
jgi:hypothetical protein